MAFKVTDPMRRTGHLKAARAVKDAYENFPLPFPVVAAMAVNVLLAKVRPMQLPGPRSLHRAAGAALVLAGVGLNLWALAERRRRSKGPFALERPEELVVTGPYAFTRHPMYVGWWLIELGAGTVVSSSWVLVTMPAELLVEHPFVLDEEAKLAELFGRSYRDYAERVPRYPVSNRYFGMVFPFLDFLYILRSPGLRPPWRLSTSPATS